MICFLIFKELKSKYELEEIKKLNKKKSNDHLNTEILTEFFTLLEEQKTTQLKKITTDIDKLKGFKSHLGIQTDFSLGSKRRA